MKWYLVLLLWLLIPLIHKQLLKLIWYRWCINSITYPVNKYKLDKRYKRMSQNDRIWSWTRYETSDHWSKDYWFGRSLSKYILLKYLDKAED